MEESGNRCPGCKRLSCDGCGIFRKLNAAASDGREIRADKLNTNKQVKIQFPQGFAMEPGEGLGLSVDAGTTTLAGMLWDLKDGQLLETETATNPQTVFGADVVSRIQAAENEEQLKEMQQLLVKKLDEMALCMAKRLAKTRGETSGRLPEGMPGDAEKGLGPKVIWEIKKVTIAGNTAMCEILSGQRPDGLLRAPFTPDYDSTVIRTGRELGFEFLKEAEVAVLPPIGGFVGSDALAVAGYVSRQEKGRKILAVDIGTNGEILLQKDEKRYACSAAAGPALEGGAIGQGMRAAAGAIDMVTVSGRFPVQDVVCRVIGGCAPAGICGSGLVDALALLRREGVVDASGYMRSPAEAKAGRAAERLCRRIREDEDGRKFLLTDEKNPVYIKAEDVRQLQLSVSAIRSGMEILLKKGGMEAEELDAVYLAGAFGSYINMESGTAIGLFPDVPRKKLVQAGNLAGTGAAMALLSPKVLRELEEESRTFIHVELAEEKDFEELFLTHMELP